MEIPDHLTCLLRNLYAGQEATVRTRHGTMDWFQIGKGVHQGCYCHLAYLTYMQSTSCEMPGWSQGCWEKYQQLHISMGSQRVRHDLLTEPQQRCAY